MSDSLLRVEGLTTVFKHHGAELAAVRELTFDIKPGESVGLVGESGCGKSVTSLSILGLLPSNGKIATGQVLFAGKNLVSLDSESIRQIRGHKISMIFQEPMTSLNPVFTIGDQVSEVLRIHKGLSKRQALARAEELLSLVRISEPSRRLREYPHQLSGGMRQRVMIAMALACEPELLIADEPTTALDVTIQAQILDLLRQLRHELKMAVFLITHDLGVVAEFCDRVMVMYAGRIVEQAPVADLFNNPQHPYTRGLLQSAPRIGKLVERLPTIEGAVPAIGELPQGCSFQNRCSEVMEKCRDSEPDLMALGQSKVKVACYRRRQEDRF